MGRNSIPSPDNQRFWESLQRNRRAFNHYYWQLYEMALAMPEWYGNLPPTINTRYLEEALCIDSMAVIWRDEVAGWACARVTNMGELNLYNEPDTYAAYASNGLFVELNRENSVLVYNNLAHTNTAPDLLTFSRRLANYDMIMDVNVTAQKTPVLILAEDEKQRLSLMNLYQKYDGDQPFIFGYKRGMTANPLTALTTGAPWIADRLYELKSKVWNEALTYLGVSNVSYNKSQYQGRDEVQRLMGGAVASRWSRLEARQTAAEALNRLFEKYGEGYNVKVQYRGDLSSSMSDTYGGPADE